MAIRKHCPQKLVEAGLGCRSLNFRTHFGNTPIGLDEFLVKSGEIDLLLPFRNRLVHWHSGADIVLDANAEHPSMGLLPGSNLEDADLGNLAQLLALRITEACAFFAT